MTYPQPGYAPAYPPQAPPAYPPQYPPAAPVYPPQYAPQFPPQQGYPVPLMAPPPPPLAQGTLDDFYSQPVGGRGAFLKFEHVGQTHAGFVARAITQGDVRQITTPPNQGSQPVIYKDGRPKFELLVPLQVQPSQANPDGLATWAVKGADRDELTRAMAEVGAPEGAPEPGAYIQITFTEARPTRGGIPQKVKRVIYTRPGGAAPVPAPVAAAPQPQYAPAPAQYAQQAAQPQYAPQQVQQLPPGQYAQPTGPIQYPPADASGVQWQAPPVPQQVPLALPVAQMQPAASAAPAVAGMASMTPEQQAFLDNLTKAQAAQ